MNPVLTPEDEIIAPTERVEQLASLELAIECTMAEAGINRALATAFCTSLVQSVCSDKTDGWGYWHPFSPWLHIYHDDVLVKVMPDDTPAAPDSAHYHLQQACGEILGHGAALTHTRVPYRQVEGCAIEISFLD